MAYTAADWSVDRATKEIRYIGDDHDGSPSYATVIEGHRAWQALLDDAFATGDDELDITLLDTSQRSTDNIITIINGYNIDDNAAEHLYDGSIIQDGGDTIYDGIVNFGVSTVQIQILQDGRIIADDFWNFGGGGLNPNATSGISHRFMLKVRSNGVDIDQRKVIGISRTYLNTYEEFKINATSRGNNVLALSDADDLNNTTVATTVDDWTAITNQEGLRLIDVDNNAVNEEYWSEWNTDQPTRDINEFYERLKWLSQDPIPEDSSADTGTDYIVDNTTITGQAQSFANGVNNVSVSKVTFPLKKTLVPTGDVTASIYTITGSHGSTAVPNALQGAISEPYEASDLTTTEYREITFWFKIPIALTASTDYCVVIEHANGGASDYVQVRGDVTGTHGGNRSENVAGWTADAAEDLAFEVYTAPLLNDLIGVELRGITHSFGYDNELGAISITVNDKLVWGTKLVYSSPSNTPLVGEAIHEDTATPVWKGRILAVDNTNLTLIVDVALDTITTAETFTGQTSTFTATVNGTPTAVVGGGTFHVLAEDTTDDILYVQVIRGTMGLDNAIIYYGGTDLENAGTCDTTDTLDIADEVDTITERTISTPFVGVSTGSALIGSYGFGVEAADLQATDTVFDLSDTPITPPNNVTNTVAGLVSTEDRVIVAPWDGSTTDVNGDPAFEKDQLSLDVALTIDNVTQVEITEAIPADTPSAGTIRVTDDNGFDRRLVYGNWENGTPNRFYSITPQGDNQEDFASVNAGATNDVYITYIDEIASGTTATFTGIRSAGQQELVLVVRSGQITADSPIKQFIAEWSLTSSPQQINAIRTSDS